MEQGGGGWNKNKACSGGDPRPDERFGHPRLSPAPHLLKHSGSEMICAPLDAASSTATVATLKFSALSVPTKICRSATWHVSGTAILAEKKRRNVAVEAAKIRGFVVES